MPHHQRHKLPLLLGIGQALRRNIATGVAIEASPVRRPETGEDHRQLLGRLLSEGLGAFDELARSLLGHPGLGRSVPLCVHQSACERELKLDLIATQRRSGRQKCHQVEAAGELLRRFDEREPLQGALSRLAP